MTDPWLNALRKELEEIAGRVDVPDTDRDGVKRDIIALFKRVDGALTDLGQIKDEIRGLVERYKQGNGVAPTPAPQFTPTISALRPTSRRVGVSSRSGTTVERFRP